MTPSHSPHLLLTGPRPVRGALWRSRDRLPSRPPAAPPRGRQDSTASHYRIGGRDIFSLSGLLIIWTFQQNWSPKKTHSLTHSPLTHHSLTHSLTHSRTHLLLSSMRVSQGVHTPQHGVFLHVRTHSHVCMPQEELVSEPAANVCQCWRADQHSCNWSVSWCEWIGHHADEIVRCIHPWHVFRSISVSRSKNLTIIIKVYYLALDEMVRTCRRLQHSGLPPNFFVLCPSCWEEISR